MPMPALPITPASRRRQDRQNKDLWWRQCDYCGADIEPRWDEILRQYQIGFCHCRDEAIRAHELAVQTKAKLERHDRWMQTIGLPRKLRDLHFSQYLPHTSDRDAFQAVQAYTRALIAALREENDLDKLNLILTSPTRGNGKTMLAACIIHEHLIFAHEVHDQQEKQQFPPALAQRLASWRFVSAVDLTEMAIRDKDGFAALRQVRGLVLDDVGQEFIRQSNADESTWMHQIYYSILNARYNAGLPTVITTNLAPQDFARYLGTSAASRLAESGYLIQLQGPDHRRGHLQAIGFKQK